MLNLVPYLLKLSISLSVVYLFYLLCLRRLTFYTWNRWYLLLYSMICFIIPFVSLYSLFSKPAIEQSPIVQYIPSIEQITIKHTHAWITDPAFTINIIYIVVIMAGMLFMLGRCLIQFYSLFRMRANAKLLYDNNVKLYHIDKPVVPFSFGNAIYINQHQHSQQELSEIIRHEFIHVKQRHSVDMIWSELLCIVNWYNPFAWLLRKAIRQNLEFIADHQVLQSGLDRKQYQYLLLKVIGTTSFSVASKFNFSSLKKRIAMMNKTKSARVNLLRFAFMLPLLAVVLLAFRDVVQQQQLKQPQPQPLPKPAQAPAIIRDTALYPVADTLRIVRATSPLSKQMKEFLSAKLAAAIATGNFNAISGNSVDTFKARAMKSISLLRADTVPERVADTAVRKGVIKPEDIQSIHIDKPHGLILITPKKGETETYNLSDPRDREAFKNKYGGELPAPPVPVQPPVAAASPEMTPVPVKPDIPDHVGVKTVPGKPVPLVAYSFKAVQGKPYPGVAPVPEAPAKPPAPEVQANSEDCFNSKGYCITVADNAGECVVIVKNKQFKIVEAATLTDWQSNKRYEDKYGPIPSVHK